MLLLFWHRWNGWTRCGLKLLHKLFYCDQPTAIAYIWKNMFTSIATRKKNNKIELKQMTKVISSELWLATRVLRCGEWRSETVFESLDVLCLCNDRWSLPFLIFRNVGDVCLTRFDTTPPCYWLAHARTRVCRLGNYHLFLASCRACLVVSRTSMILGIFLSDNFFKRCKSNFCRIVNIHAAANHWLLCISRHVV